MVFENPKTYTTADLDSEKRRRLKIAGREFTVKPMTDLAQFKAQAFPVYLDFYQRTNYVVGANRVKQEAFFQWAEGLFRCTGLLILGAYQGDTLRGLCTSFRLENTLYCASLLCTTESLRLHLPNFMLHVIRESAAACPGLIWIYPGMYHGNTSLDAFYIERGAKILRKPAIFRGNPLGLALARKFSPNKFAKLTGALSEAEMAWVAQSNSAGTALPPAVG